MAFAWFAYLFNWFKPLLKISQELIVLVYMLWHWHYQNGSLIRFTLDCATNILYHPCFFSAKLKFSLAYRSFPLWLLPWQNSLSQQEVSRTYICNEQFHHKNVLCSPCRQRSQKLNTLAWAVCRLILLRHCCPSKRNQNKSFY